MTRWEKHDPTDLEELASWAARIILFGVLAAAVLVIGLIVLALWAFGGTPA